MLKEESEIVILEDDDKKPRISWRGDGQFFVVSSVGEKGVVVIETHCYIALNARQFYP